MRKIVVAVVLAGMMATVSPVSAAPQALEFDLFGRQQDTYVEQQSPAVFNHQSPESWLDFCPEECVKNITTCNWDVDDHEDYHAGGTLQANTTISITDCIVWDGAYNWAHYEKIQAHVHGKTAGWSAELTNSLGESWPLEPVYDSAQRNYSATVCLSIRRDHPVDGYPEIPGTNGGRGIPVDYTLSMTGGTRAVRDVVGILHLGARGVFDLC